MTSLYRCQGVMERIEIQEHVLQFYSTVHYRGGQCALYGENENVLISAPSCLHLVHNRPHERPCIPQKHKWNVSRGFQRRHGFYDSIYNNWFASPRALSWPSDAIGPLLKLVFTNSAPVNPMYINLSGFEVGFSLKIMMIRCGNRNASAMLDYKDFATSQNNLR